MRNSFVGIAGFALLVRQARVPFRHRFSPLEVRPESFPPCHKHLHARRLLLESQCFHHRLHRYLTCCRSETTERANYPYVRSDVEKPSVLSNAAAEEVVGAVQRVRSRYRTR